LAAKELFLAWLESSCHPAQLHSKFRRVYKLLENKPLCKSSGAYSRVWNWLQMVCATWEASNEQTNEVEESESSECLGTRFFKEILPHFCVVLGNTLDFTTNKHLMLSH
jgi:hypothetical protein